MFLSRRYHKSGRVLERVTMRSVQGAAVQNLCSWRGCLRTCCPAPKLWKHLAQGEAGKPSLRNGSLLPLLGLAHLVRNPCLLGSAPALLAPRRPGLTWKTGEEQQVCSLVPQADGQCLRKGNKVRSGRCLTCVWKSVRLRKKETEASLLPVL